MRLFSTDLISGVAPVHNFGRPSFWRRLVDLHFPFLTCLPMAGYPLRGNGHLPKGHLLHWRIKKPVVQESLSLEVLHRLLSHQACQDSRIGSQAWLLTQLFSIFFPSILLCSTQS